MRWLCLVFLVAALPAPSPAGDATTDKSIRHWIAQLKSKEVRERQDAAEALGHLGPRAAEAVPALIEALKDWRVARLASRSLVRIGPEAVPALHKAGAADRELTGTAFNTVWKIGAAGVPALIASVRSDNAEVRSHAIAVLSELGSAAEQAVPVLSDTVLHRNLKITLARIHARDRGLFFHWDISIDDDPDGERAAAAQ